MKLAVYLPPQAEQGPVPVLYFLSGLTCSEQNFTTKAGAQQYAAQHGLMLVVPDTSPRGLDLPQEHDSDDFGSGASFYVDASVEPWSRHYRMHTYITRELPELIAQELPADTARQGIFGHSMGGHGALTCALTHPDRYRSVSAFAPIVHPMACPWGVKAFSGYLGEDRDAWRAYDACELVRRSSFRQPILIDQGLSDPFLSTQLLPEHFELACAEAGVPLNLRRHAGYDHSYYFISTFIADHLAHHARALQR